VPEFKQARLTKDKTRIINKGRMNFIKRTPYKFGLGWIVPPQQSICCMLKYKNS
jgi:hypothetical protein